MKCTKCNSENIELILDARELAEFHCKDCDSRFKKAKGKEIIDFYESKLANCKPEEPKETTPCRYCYEDYYIAMGRAAYRYVKMFNDYCPMCGRKK